MPREAFGLPKTHRNSRESRAYDGIAGAQRFAVHRVVHEQPDL